MLHLELSGRVGRAYSIETSTNLLSWTLLTSGAALNGVLQVADTNAVTGSYKFYRALLQGVGPTSTQPVAQH